MDWDDTVPDAIREPWLRWRSELNLLSTNTSLGATLKRHLMSQHSNCTDSVTPRSKRTQLWCICAWFALMAMYKTKVAPIKKLTIPRLELCGAVLLAQLLDNIRKVFNLPTTQLYTWTDSTIVLSWLNGDPKRFKTYVCNRVSNIVELIGPDRWRHVCGAENPADCASRGLFPSEILHHELWWNGPDLTG